MRTCPGSGLTSWESLAPLGEVRHLARTGICQECRAVQRVEDGRMGWHRAPRWMRRGYRVRYRIGPSGTDLYLVDEKGQRVTS